MHITCEQIALDEALHTVHHAISSRATLPILANVLIVAESGMLKLSATNLEIGITVRLEDVEIIEEGSITLPAKLFSEFVHTLPASLVELHVESHSTTMHITSARSRASIKGMPTTEFPAIPTTEGSDLPVELDAAQLKEMISQVAFTAANDDSRPALTGVLVQMTEGKITFAAADAFRLAVREADVIGDEHPDILIPARTLTELARILPAVGLVEMVVTPNRAQVLFHTPNLDLVSRLVEGQFPPYRQIIPDLPPLTRVVVDTKEFAAVIKSTLLFARGSSNILRLSVGEAESELGNGCLTVEAVSEDIGDSTSSIAASIDGPAITLMFNAKYIGEALAVIGTPEVALELSHPNKPGLLKPVNESQQLYVVMPMHLNR